MKFLKVNVSHARSYEMHNLCNANFCVPLVHLKQTVSEENPLGATVSKGLGLGFDELLLASLGGLALHF